MAKKILGSYALNALHGALMIAAQQYRDNAAEFGKLIEHKPREHDMMQIHGDTARRLRDQFQKQADEASLLAHLLGESAPLTIEYDPEFLEEDDLATLKSL